MKKKKVVLLSGAVLMLMLAGGELFAGNFATAVEEGKSVLPVSLSSYGDEGWDSTWDVLMNRVKKTPFNLVATLIFACAIIHTFLAFKFHHWANGFKEAHEKRLRKDAGRTLPKNAVCYKAEVFHFLGEIEAVFGIWLLPLILAIIYFYDWNTVVNYFDNKVNYSEPVFVVVIMTMAATRPILKLSERCLKNVAELGQCSPMAWWFSILTIAPILGSFITEPAAMTIAALVLGHQFYELKPSSRLCYATVGLLFVNISVGGTLTHFAAPPVLMVADTWGWGMKFMFVHFGWKAVTGIVISNVIYYCIFRNEFNALKKKVNTGKKKRTKSPKDEEKDYPIPVMVTIAHILFLVWTVANLHNMPLFIGGFLFFLAFTQITLHHQFQVSIKMPLLVGFFLAGLVTHGGLQQWWIAPVLGGLAEVPLFIYSAVLTAFNDNAAITFLATLVPEFDGNIVLQRAVVAGAVSGGGLTIIANAPNPAGRSILDKYFEGGLSPIKLFAGAMIPTIIVSCCFMLLP